MIRVLATMFAKALLETAIVLLAVGAVLLVFSYRVTRRVVTTTPDPLERFTARAMQFAALIPQPRTPAADPSPDEETET